MATTQKHLDKVEMEENKKEQGVVMNEQQIKLRELCSNPEVSIKEVSDYYFSNNHKFNAVDTLECMKHFVDNICYSMCEYAKRYNEVSFEAQQGVQKDTDMKNSSNP